MADRPAIAIASEQPAIVYCSRCAADLTSLPLEARFCNRCGVALPEQTELPATAAAEPFQPPLILLAYAKALFNLGWRYESALGSRRNLREAERCYCKAARLGDVAALSRRGQPTVRPSVPPLASVYQPPAH